MNDMLCLWPHLGNRRVRTKQAELARLLHSEKRERVHEPAVSSPQRLKLLGAASAHVEGSVAALSMHADVRVLEALELLGRQL